MSAVKRYSLQVPEELWDEVKAIADRRNEPVVTVIRRFLKIGLTLTAAADEGGRIVVERDDDLDLEVVIL